MVNDLNLEVAPPDGKLSFLGNWFANGASATGGSPDNRNNVEMVLVEHPEPGVSTVAVRAAEVNVSNIRQGYALVTTADLSVPLL